MEPRERRGVASPGSYPGRARNIPREVGRGPPSGTDARNPASWGPSGLPESANGDGSAADREPGSRTREKEDCESWVREKVLFLLHPERWLGTQGDPSHAQEIRGEDLPQLSGGRLDPEGDGPAPVLPGKSTSGRRLATAPGARSPPRSVLVRVVDYQVTQEVLRTAWTRGRMTTRTEERSMTAVTFRTPRE